MKLFNSAASDTATANDANPIDTHPRSSLLAFWRRLTFISQRNQSPVNCFQPDQCSASASSDIARNCAAVKVGFEDIDSFLSDVEDRLRSGPDFSRGRVGDLSPLGHLVGIDIYRLVALVRALRSAEKKVA